jgi:hypothetical protein
MFGGYWYREFRGAAAYWIASLTFTLVGVVFTVLGVWVEETLLLVGVPFLFLGGLILVMLIYSLYLKLNRPEKHPTWLWWVNFVGGLAGALLFAIPSTFVLPVLLLAGLADFVWLGALFTVIGAMATVAVGAIAVRQYRQRPR